MNFLKKNSPLLFLITILILFESFSSYTQLILRYERSSILEGELWRLLSAHLVHGSLEHLWLNLIALVMIWMLFKSFISNTLWWVFMLLSAFSISVSLFIFMEHLEWYVGLSGVLHSMLVFGSIGGLIQGRREFLVLLAFVLVKILSEQFYGTYSSAMFNEDVVVNAHMYGATIGLVLGILLLVLQKKANQENP